MGLFSLLSCSDGLQKKIPMNFFLHFFSNRLQQLGKTVCTSPIITFIRSSHEGRQKLFDVYYDDKGVPKANIDSKLLLSQIEITLKSLGGCAHLWSFFKAKWNYA